MRRSRLKAGLVVLAAMALLAAACGEDGDQAPPAAAGTVCGSYDKSAGDLLAEVCQSGEIRVSTDPAYPPQSSLNKQTNDYEGFDIDVANEIGDRLGVAVEWETPSWDLIIAGSWNGRWDMSVGSMTPTNRRQRVLFFTEPYYYTPAVVVVHADNTSTTDLSSDLDGKKIGVCSGCTYEFFLDKSLEITGFTFDFIIDNAEITGYDTDTTALQDLSLGDGTRLDAVITSVTTAQGYIDAGNPVKIVGEPVFYEPLAVSFDKSSELDPTTLVDSVATIVVDMHADGTLSQLSEEWYNGIDLSVQI